MLGPDLREDRLSRIELSKIDKSPHLDMFDVFLEMNLRGMPLVNALNAVVVKAKDIYKDVSVKVDVRRIPSYKYETGKFIPTNQSEDKVLQELHKSLTFLDYDAVILNMTSLINFYKEAYYNALAYKFFYDYMQQLLTKFKEINDVIKDYESSKLEIDQLKSEMMSVMKENEKFKSQRDTILNNAKKLQNYFTDMFAQKKVMEFFLANSNRLTVMNQEGISAMQLVMMIIFEGRMSIDDVSKGFKMSKKEVKELLSNYEDLFIVYHDEYIDLNFKHDEIKDDKILMDLETFMTKSGLNKIELRGQDAGNTTGNNTEIKE